MTGDELIASRDSLDAPLLILAAMTLPLNDVSAIVCRCAAHIQALAAVLRDEARVAVRRGLETKCLIVACIAGPLNDRQTVIERPLRYIEALLTVTRDELVEARYRERPQEARERPVRDVRTLCARHRVPESKVNAFENASLDDIIGGGREPLVRACLIDSLGNGGYTGCPPTRADVDTLAASDRLSRADARSLAV